MNEESTLPAFLGVCPSNDLAVEYDNGSDRKLSRCQAFRGDDNRLTHPELVVSRRHNPHLAPWKRENPCEYPTLRMCPSTLSPPSTDTGQNKVCLSRRFPEWRRSPRDVNLELRENSLVLTTA